MTRIMSEEGVGVNETTPLVSSHKNSDENNYNIKDDDAEMQNYELPEDDRRDEAQGEQKGRISVPTPYSLSLVLLSLLLLIMMLISVSSGQSGGVQMVTQFLSRSSTDVMSKQITVNLFFNHDIPSPNTSLNVAFVGNSMMYFNDFPRFFATMSSGRVTQNSCLHGGGSIPSLITEGNSMYPQFHTENAILEQLPGGHVVFDYGACTPMQLMLGTDPRLDDPGYAQPADRANLNPCREIPLYLNWTKTHITESNWHAVVINDNTRNPARRSSRALSLAFLEQSWLPLLKQTGAAPVFLWTYAYSIESTPTHNMVGLEDVANFTSLTYAGYKAYADLLRPLLPASQQPRNAPVGLAFLLIYEENIEVWHTLFHNADHLHSSPSGSFLQACIVHYTIFGKMPDRDHVILDNMDILWSNARMMQHAWEPPNPYPTRKEAKYLYHVAERIMVHSHVPSSFIDYQHGEVAYGQD